MRRDTDKSGKRSVAKGHLPSRRQLLKGAAAVAGATAGSSVIGAPNDMGAGDKVSSFATSASPTSVVKAIGDQAARISASRSRCRTSILRPRSIASSPSRTAWNIPDLEGWQAKLAANAA